VAEIHSEAYGVSLYAGLVGPGRGLDIEGGQQRTPGPDLGSDLHELGIRPGALSGEMRGIEAQMGGLAPDCLHGPGGGHVQAEFPDDTTP